MKDKLEQEYEKKGLFSFLSKNTLGNSVHTHNVLIQGPNLVSSEYVLEHPNSDLEKYYVKEIINILVQEEIKQFLPKLKEISVPVDDSQDNIIFTNKKSTYQHAKVFYCAIENDFCIPRNKIFIKSYLPSLVLTGDSKIISAAWLNFNVDRAPTQEELESQEKSENAERLILKMHLKEK